MAKVVVTTFNVYVSYYTITMVFWMLGSILLIKRLHLFPINGQLPPMLVLQNAAYLVVFHGCAIPLLYPQINCFTAINITSFGGMIAVIVVIFRRIALLFRLEIQKNMNELRAGGQMSWWTVNRRYFKAKPLTVVAVVMVIIGYLPIIIVTAANPLQFTQTCHQIGLAPDVVTVIIYVILTHATFMVLQLALAKRLAKHPDDSFGGTIALKLNTMSVMLLSLGMIIFTAAVPEMESMFQIAFFLVPTLSAFILTWWPVLLTFRAKLALLKIDLKSIPFGDLLLSDEGYHAFSGYLYREFSQENLLFYADTSTFLTALAAQAPVMRLGKGTVFPSCLLAERGEHVVVDKRHDHESQEAYQHRVVSELLAAAERIYEKHISPNAPFQVNLSAHLFQQITSHLAKAKQAQANSPADAYLQLGELYLDARQAVMRLMRQDSFPRFVTSAAFKELEQHDHKVRVTIVAHGSSAASEGTGDSAIAITLKNWADLGALDRSDDSSHKTKPEDGSRGSKNPGGKSVDTAAAVPDSPTSRAPIAPLNTTNLNSSTHSSFKEPLSARSLKFASIRPERAASNQSYHKTSTLIEMGVPSSAGGGHPHHSTLSDINPSNLGSNPHVRSSESNPNLIARASGVGPAFAYGDEASPTHHSTSAVVVIQSNPLASNISTVVVGANPDDPINEDAGNNDGDVSPSRSLAPSTAMEASPSSRSGLPALEASPTSRSLALSALAMEASPRSILNPNVPSDMVVVDPEDDGNASPRA